MKFLGKPVPLLAAALALAPFPAAAVPADFRQRAEAQLAASVPADGPGMSAIVTEGGRTVYAGGRGLANVEAHTPITPQTVFRLGSITKQFTSSVIMQLVDEGRISLDDPLSRFLPDYPQPAAAVTVRQLLNHTSGIQSYTGIPGWMVEANTNRAHTTAEMVGVFSGLPLVSPPGARWQYNNSGYVLLAAIIERVTGMPWHEAVARRIARPLGLATIRYGVGEEGVPLMAHGYTGRAGAVRPAQLIHMSVPSGAGALLGSAEDLARWAQALHHGRVVSAASYQKMIAPTVLNDGSTNPYGFGLANTQVRGRRAITHNGGIFGFSTDSIYLPDQDIFVAVLANSDSPPVSPGTTLRRLAAIALGDPYPSFARVAVDPAAVEPFLGVYAAPGAGGERRFFQRDGRLFTRRAAGGPEQEVFAAGGNRFFYGPDSLTWFTVSRDASGAVTMAMHPNGEDRIETAPRTGAAPPEAPTVAVPRPILASYVGTYVSAGPRIAVALGEDGGLTVTLGGPRPLPMRAISETEFQLEAADVRIVFQRENGAVTRLLVRQGTREMPATREAVRAP
jgi:CubicO group peptidase (beta-lactamase class C family)